MPLRAETRLVLEGSTYLSLLKALLSQSNSLVKRGTWVFGMAWSTSGDPHALAGMDCSASSFCRSIGSTATVLQRIADPESKS